MSGASSRSAVSRVERERRRVMGSTSSSKRRRGRDGTVAPRRTGGWARSEKGPSAWRTSSARRARPVRYVGDDRTRPVPSPGGNFAGRDPARADLERLADALHRDRGGAARTGGQRVHPDPRLRPARRGDVHRPPRRAHVRPAQRVPVHDRAPDGPAVPGDRRAGGARRRRGRRAVGHRDRRRRRPQGGVPSRAASTSGSTSARPPAGASASTSTSTSCRGGPATATS